MSGRMDRLQFYLEPELNIALNQLAQEAQVSKAELIRQGIRLLLKEKGVVLEEPAFDLIGLFDVPESAPLTDWARRHDEIVYRRDGER